MVLGEKPVFEQKLSQLQSFCVLALAAMGFACKSRVEYRDNPEIVLKLQRCQTSLEEKANYIKDLEARIAELEMKGGKGDVVVLGEGSGAAVAANARLSDLTPEVRKQYDALKAGK